MAIDFSMNTTTYTSLSLVVSETKEIKPTLNCTFCFSKFSMIVLTTSNRETDPSILVSQNSIVLVSSSNRCAESNACTSLTRVLSVSVVTAVQRVLTSVSVVCNQRAFETSLDLTSTVKVSSMKIYRVLRSSTTLTNSYKKEISWSLDNQTEGLNTCGPRVGKQHSLMVTDCK